MIASSDLLFLFDVDILRRVRRKAMNWVASLMMLNKERRRRLNQ